MSASRRCDVPRHMSDRFIRRVREGFVDVANPFDARKTRRVSLLPEDVDVFVFWTRDPRPLLRYAGELDALGYRYYFMTTFTGYPPVIEPNGPAVSEALDMFSMLAEAVGPARSIWRYDPVFLTDRTDEAFHRRNFAVLSEMLGPFVERVVFSAYTEYRKSKGRVAALAKCGAAPRSMRAADGTLLPATEDLLRDLAAQARTRGLEARACAEAQDLLSIGLEPNACVDGELIRRLWNIDTPKKRDPNQRPACRCAPSVDIGSYDACPAGCVYCYATSALRGVSDPTNTRLSGVDD